MTDAAKDALRVERLTDGVRLPARMTDGSAGFDLTASCAVRLDPGGRALVPTGLRIALPAGTQGEIRPRSGLALRTGVTVLNAPGTIDEDYRGELKVLLVNLGREPVALEAGERIAQLVVLPYLRPPVVEVAGLDGTDRGDGGFGHSGRF